MRGSESGNGHKGKSYENQGHTKKLVIHAAMIVPGYALRIWAVMPPLENGLNLRRPSSVHRKSVVRLDFSKGFEPTSKKRW